MIQSITSPLAPYDWERVTTQLHEHGYSVLPQVLTDKECRDLADNYSSKTQYRKTVVMERYRFGLGEYKYFNYPLPYIVQHLRETLYPKLVPIANTWMKVLNLPLKFPDTLEEFHGLCREHNQLKNTVLLLKYGAGGHNTLHQDLYGDVYFPIQTVLFLNEPEKEYTGGEFVLTQQSPRAQSKVIVLRPKKGDMLIFTTSFRPVKGKKGYYKANIKHGVSQIHSGTRHTLGIIFHDALT